MNCEEDDDSCLCPVCKEHFTDGAKAPACLRCGHVLCQQCAYIILSNSDASCRVCPICRGPSAFDDVRIVYIGNIRLTNESSTLETENEQLRQRLRSTEKECENNLRTLRWYQKEHLEKCNQRSKMLSYYQKSNGNLYRKMRYYRDNWYRLRSHFEKLKAQRNRINSELSFMKSRYTILNRNRGGTNYYRRQSYGLRVPSLCHEHTYVSSSISLFTKLGDIKVNMNTLGQIVRIKCHNVLTYKNIEIYPCPQLNLIIGANGSGKSTIISAIILGLGGDARVVGRATELSKYVKVGYKKALIEIELYNPNGENDIIVRQFDVENRSRFELNGKHVTQEKIERMAQKYHIRINNLCQILPQEKLEHFAKMNDHERLENTLKTVGDSSLIKYLMEIKESRDKEASVRKKVENMKVDLADVVSKRDNMAAEARLIREKEFLIESLRLLKQRRAWQLYFHVKQTVNKVNDVLANKQNVYQNMVTVLKRTLTDVNAREENLKREKRATVENEASVRALLLELKKKQNDINVCTDKVNDIKTAYDQKAAKYRTQEADIKSLKEKIRKLNEEVSDDSLLISEMECMTLQIAEENQKVRKIAHDRDMANDSLEAKMNELNAIQYRLSRLNDVKDMKMKFLERYYPDNVTALKWVEENRGSFRGEVYGPMFLYVNVKDAANAKYVENSVGNRDLLAFICQYREDTSTLSKQCHERMKLRINIVSALQGVTDDDLRPAIPISDLRQFGFHSYVSDYIDGPDIITKYMIVSYHLNGIPVGDRNTFAMADRIPSQIKVYFTDKYRISNQVAELTGQRIESSNEIADARLLQVSANRADLHELQTRKQECEEEVGRLKAAYNKFKEEASFGDNRLNEMKSKLKKLSDRKLAQVSLRETLKDRNRDLRNLQSNVIDPILERNKRNLEVKLMLARVTNMYLELGHMFKKLFESFLLYQRNKVDDRQRHQVHNKNLVITSRFVESLKSEADSLRKLEWKKRKLARYCVLFHQYALKCTKNVDPRTPRFKSRKVFFKLDSRCDILARLIDRFQAKINCLGGSNNGMEIFHMHKKLVAEVDRLQRKIERKETNLQNYTTRMNEIKGIWVRDVQSLVAVINANFQKFFANMNCAGEISLYKGENEEDFSQYGIHIKVKFREEADLQILNAQVQSGGERAVSVAIYLLSLQELTTVPFRCIDEINQGMDADNERRIFNLITRTTEERCQTQYFLLTPKLLPRLNFTTNCKIFCPYNGVGSMPHDRVSQKIEDRFTR